MSATRNAPQPRRHDIAPVYEDQETIIRRLLREELAPLHALLLELRDQDAQVGVVALAATE